MYLFFDTETTGLPRNYNAPVTDLANWPRLVQLAYLLFDDGGNRIAGSDAIVKPVGFTIPAEAARIHGITTDRAQKEGKELLEVLQDFQNIMVKAKCLVAHNISFDEKIIGAEFLRSRMQNNIPTKTKICTMQSATNYCALPGMYGYKWPKLAELHRKLFDKDFEEAHNAAADISATVRCFWELKRLGIIKV